MKTIKLIILAALLLPVLTSHAQTKEETIAWLKEKLGNYMYLPTWNQYHDFRNLIVKSINECEITINYEVSDKDEKVWEFITLIYPTSGCKFDAKGDLSYDAKVLKHINGDKSINYYNANGYLKIANREDNIYQRIEKAIAHLATFCPKKKEAF